MIGRLRGDIVESGKEYVILETGGVGYLVRVPESQLPSLRNRKNVILYIETVVRQDAINLYGFSSPEEVQMFRLLLSVSRVGPQLALSVLSRLPVPDIAMAIVDENEKILSSIPGIGPTSAKRIILELKKKVSPYCTERTGPGSDERNDAILALVALGFSEAEASSAVNAVLVNTGPCDLSLIIRESLTKLKQ